MNRVRIAGARYKLIFASCEGFEIEIVFLTLDILFIINVHSTVGFPKLAAVFRNFAEITRPQTVHSQT